MVYCQSHDFINVCSDRQAHLVNLYFLLFSCNDLKNTNSWNYETYSIYLNGSHTLVTNSGQRNEQQKPSLYINVQHRLHWKFLPFFHFVCGIFRSFVIVVNIRSVTWSAWMNRLLDRRVLKMFRNSLTLIFGPSFAHWSRTGTTLNEGSPIELNLEKRFPLNIPSLRLLLVCVHSDFLRLARDILSVRLRSLFAIPRIFDAIEFGCWRSFCFLFFVFRV